MAVDETIISDLVKCENITTLGFGEAFAFRGSGCKALGFRGASFSFLGFMV